MHFILLHNTKSKECKKQNKINIALKELFHRCLQVGPAKVNKPNSFFYTVDAFLRNPRKKICVKKYMRHMANLVICTGTLKNRVRWRNSICIISKNRAKKQKKKSILYIYKMKTIHKVKLLHNAISAHKDMQLIKIEIEIRNYSSLVDNNHQRVVGLI